MSTRVTAVSSGILLLGAAAMSAEEPSAPLKTPIPVVQSGGVEEGYVQTARGVFVYYRKVGSGPLLFVVHGGPGGDHQQMLDLERLSDRFTLLYYDQRGGGRSTRDLAPEEVAWPKHVSDLEALREAFGQDQLRVLAYSFGGILLQLYAVEHPDRLRRVVFVGTTLPTSQNMQQIGATMTARLSPETSAWMGRMKPLGLLDSNLEWMGTVFIRKLWVEAFLHPDHREAFDLTKLNASRSGRHTSESLKEVSSSAEFWKGLAKVKAPVLSVHGTYDPVPLEGAKELVSLLPDARLVVIEDSGHMPWLEAPDEFFPPVLEFLALERN